MKKLVALLLGTAMVATSVVGLVACNKGGGGGNGKRRDDPRQADAYEAYNNEGNLVGSYKTIADAINATVEADLDFMEDENVEDGTQGGYVTKKGSTRRIFQNKKGFAEGNSDNFWYYVNGTELTGYNCWDNTGTDADSLGMITNSKVITHETTGMGVNSIQSWNGYGLLDEKGAEITDTIAQSWELGSAMDASVLTFPVRKQGVAGLRYKFDLSEIQITPPYKGIEDKVYAFIGVYAWQDYFVIADGIACDTETGDWYEYQGTSRDNSFSDVEYNIGKKIMSSKWTSLGNGDGYWTPEAKEMELQIKTVKKTDEIDDTVYFVDEYTFTLDGEVAFETVIDEEKVNALQRATYSQDNGYVFTAGLDIKNPIETGVSVKNVDFFNGARFLNLVVTEAQVYFPTEEELDDIEAKVSIDPTLRGQWFDMLLANDTDSNGTYDYTILQTYACTTYEAKDGVDYYSFRYDGTPVSEKEIGGKLAEYQAKIDRLAGMTAENISDYLDDYDEVAKWYGSDASHAQSSGMAQQYLNLLDFAGFEKAKPEYEKSFNLTEEAKAFITKFETLGALTDTSYPYKDWKKPADSTEEGITGYFWDEAEYFNTIREDYKKLSADQQASVLRLLGEAKEQNFYDWEEAYDSLKEYFDNADYVAKSYKLANMTMNSAQPDAEYTGETAMQKMVAILFRVRTGFFKDDSQKPVYTFNSNDTNGFKYEFHLLFLMKKMEEAGVKIPDFVQTMLGYATESTNGKAFLDDFNNYIYPVLTLAGEIYARQQKGEYVWLDEDIAEVINAHMIGVDGFTEGGFAWNITNNNDLRDGNTDYEHYFGLPDEEKNFKASLKYIFDVVAECDPTATVSASGLGFDADVTPLTEDPTENGSEDAVAMVTKIQEFVALADYNFVGWKTEEDAEGYLYNDLTSFRALAEERTALETKDQAYVNAQLAKEENAAYKANYEAWETFSAEMKTLEESEAWSKTFETFEKATGKTTKSYTAEEAFAELLHVAFKIKTEGKTEDAGDSEVAKVGALSVDDNFNSAARLVSFYDFFMENEAELPAFVTDLTDELGVPAYYNNFFYPLAKMVKLAVRIQTAPVAKIEELTDEEMDFLNTYWVSTYEMQGLLKQHWYANNGYFGWIGWKMEAQFTAMLGGTLAGKARPNDYADILNDFLTKSGYILNASTHNWGVTATKIEPITYSADVLAFIDKYSALSDLGAYNYLGWEAPGETPIKGYLYSEALYFDETVAPAYTALTPDDQAAADGYTQGGYANWKQFAADIKALNANEAFGALQIAAVDKGLKTPTTYSGKDALGQILNAFAEIGAGKTISSDGCFNAAFRMMFFKLRLEENGVTLPKYVSETFTAVTTGDDNAQQFTGDLLYLDAVLMLASKIQALEESAKLDLTEDVLGYIDLLVGKNKFDESGMNWNYTTANRWGSDPAFSDLTARTKDYKLYYGLTADAEHYLNVYQKLVIEYLVKNYNAKALTYDAKDAPEDSYMGIEEDIVVPE